MKLSHADAPPPFQPGKPVGNIYYGACSWTDRMPINAGTFYPPSVRTAADRLAHNASRFPILEVDATYYAPPSERNAQLCPETVIMRKHRDAPRASTRTRKRRERVRKDLPWFPTTSRARRRW
jgi:Protein of unknown function DUF72